ncbi:MAG: sugar phosphate isomerase/epimerase, partial [Bacteroidales bacterium]|nr:sugar phosphate isomerase/epimerase [Bacteroidales bacterium]
MSNIAWNKEDDDEMYVFLCENDFTGLEIAPTRIFPENPYEKLIEAKKFAQNLNKRYGLSISSIQSILYGKSENIFNSVNEREKLINYTKKAIDFAEAVRCKNLVFGCSKNRNIPPNYPADKIFETAFVFFNEIGHYARKKGTVIALEPNPIIYGTNFINSTKEAFDFCRQSGIDSLKVNVDLGTIIYAHEKENILYENIELINHIHISEPYLLPIEKRNIHKAIKNLS